MRLVIVIIASILLFTLSIYADALVPNFRSNETIYKQVYIETTAISHSCNGEITVIELDCTLPQSNQNVQTGNGNFWDFRTQSLISKPLKEVGYKFIDDISQFEFG